MWNAARHWPKLNVTGSNWGTTIILQGSVEKVHWFDILKLVDDFEFANLNNSTFDSNALDGDDFPYKRIKIEYESDGGSSPILKAHQYIQLVLVPN